MDLTKYVTLDVEEVLRESERAWYVQTKDGEKRWYPKSQCRLEGWKLYVPKWILKDRE